MEFGEKLQELRKSRGLTQEELAVALYVSRTAVSKWESGRGYPSIDSLKEISKYFSVTIDDLLSGEKLISIAEKENKSNIRNICDLMFGMTDLFSFLLIVLPLYPWTVDGYVYSVNLFSYTETTILNRTVYWALFLALVLIGAVKISLTQLRAGKDQKTVTLVSMVMSVVLVIYLALAGETYAVTLAFLLLLIKGILLFRQCKAEH
ncbi:MAG: helix-turn-helix transcriptional regulator [Ruminococcaceae bacterium]|nr:helix-turn-helix transcriptional regulator [Oscillospiraceae bacterium]